MKTIIELVQHLSALIFASIIAGVLFAFSLLSGLFTAICAVLASIAGVFILLALSIYERVTGNNEDNGKEIAWEKEVTEEERRAAERNERYDAIMRDD